jgi:hypothetical protein
MVVGWGDEWVKGYGVACFRKGRLLGDKPQVSSMGFLM